MRYVLNGLAMLALAATAVTAHGQFLERETDDALSSRALRIVEVASGGNRLLTEGGHELRLTGRTEVIMGDRAFRGNEARQLLEPGVTVRALESREIGQGARMLERVEIVVK